MTIHCQAEINHLGAAGPEPSVTTILDGRRTEPRPTFDDHGFELRTHVSAVEDFTDTAAVDAIHYAEIRELALAHTGADAVLYYPALVRSPAAERVNAQLGPVQVAHSDYTPAYRAMLGDTAHPYHEILRPSVEAAGLTAQDVAAATRVVTLQYWRNIGPLRPAHPLAFCDRRTVTQEELVPYLVEEYGGVRTEFESYLLAPPAEPTARRWYTFPSMTRDEVVMFRAFDSDLVERGEPFWTPHSAFRDPTAGDDAPPRASIEMRAICLFLG